LVEMLVTSPCCDHHDHPGPGLPGRQAPSRRRRRFTLDDQLKLLDSTMRSDLSGVTARFTPPSILPRTWVISSMAKTNSRTARAKTAMTTSASPPRPRRPAVHRPDVGYHPALAIPNGDDPRFYNGSGNVQPVTVTSEYAEIIYFLRNATSIAGCFWSLLSGNRRLFPL